MKWPSDRLERASVNSFGIGGMNAHVDPPHIYLTNAYLANKEYRLSWNQPLLME